MVTQLQGWLRISLSASFLCVVPATATGQAVSPSVSGCPMFPADHIYNTPVDSLPVHQYSDTYVSQMGGGGAHPDWGSDAPGGWPVNVVKGNSTPPATVNIEWPGTSDPGPYPIPSNALIGSADAHMIVLDTDNCMLYEAYAARQNADGSYSVVAIVKFNLRSYDLKPPYWSSSNAAGTAQLPLLVRYDELASGAVRHAVSITSWWTTNAWVWPASHYAGWGAYPPMGTRFRLKSSFDISQFPPQAKVVAQALKTYGAIVTDNGASWHIQGVADPRFDDLDLHTLTQIHPTDWEAVDESSLEISPLSGKVAKTPAPLPFPMDTWVKLISRNSRQCMDVRGVSLSIGAQVQQWPCWDGPNQQFLIAPLPSGGYTFNVQNSGYQFDIQGAGQANGALLIQFPFWGGANETFSVNPTGDGYFTIVASHSGKCLDVEGISLIPGANVYQWQCWNGPNQQWQIVPLPHP